MKKTYFNLCIIIFYGLAINKLLSSNSYFPKTPPIQAPFIIPTIGNSPNCAREKSPLSLLVPTDESENLKLSIILEKITTYSQCPYIPYYEKKEQEKIATLLFSIRHKIDNFHNENKKRTNSVYEYNQEYNTQLTNLMIDEAILVHKIHALQEYKKSAQLRLDMNNR